MSEKGDQTNLASEFYVLSLLHRIGAEAHLTLGNKKSIDIFVIKDGKSLTIDVKGIQDGYSFPIGNYKEKVSSDTHYLAFVSYGGNIKQTDALPEVFVVPAKDLEKPQGELEGKALVANYEKSNNVLLGDLKKCGGKYRNNFSVFKGEPQ